MEPDLRHVSVALAALTAIRLIGLHFSTVDLYFDEAQYWAWSRDISFGYFSKPPLLAWIIALTTGVCGNGKLCVRAASPLLYFATCLIVYAIAVTLYDRRTAAWSALTLALATGLSFSARIISTDVPLIFFWALALLAYVKLLPAPDWRAAIMLGVACGLGLLAKYAMIYFVLCGVCAACCVREARALLMRPQTWIALFIALLIVSPNLYWNLHNEFLTLRHTGKNIAGAGPHLDLSSPVAFVVAQFALAGPIVFATFLSILLRIGARTTQGDRLMLAFAIPPLALVTLFSFVRHTHANWAAPSILSLTILVVAWWLRRGQWRLLGVTLVIGLIFQAMLLAGDVYAYRITVPLLGHDSDLYRRTLGWRALGEHTLRLAHSVHAPTVAAQDRSDLAVLTYYLRDTGLRVVSWPSSTIPHSSFDRRQPFTDSTPEPVLLITECRPGSRLTRFFQDVESLGTFTTKSGPTSFRRFHAFKLANRRLPIEPIRVCR